MQSRAVRQPSVCIRNSVIETTTARRDEPLRETSNCLFVIEHDVGCDRPGAAVDPDRTRPVDQHVGNVLVVEKLLQHTRSDDFVDDGAGGLEHLRSACNY